MYVLDLYVFCRAISIQVYRLRDAHIGLCHVQVNYKRYITNEEDWLFISSVVAHVMKVHINFNPLINDFIHYA